MDVVEVASLHLSSPTRLEVKIGQAWACEEKVYDILVVQHQPRDRMIAEVD